MTTVFDFLNAINFDKRDMFADPQVDEKDYVPFLINRGLSYFQDTVFLANELNRYPTLPKNQQFEFLLHSVTKRRRFSKWSKKDPSTDDLDMVQRHYNFSRGRAVEALGILTADQLADLRSRTTQGGSTNPR